MFESWKEREFEKKMERFRTALQEKNTILMKSLIPQLCWGE